MSDIITRIIQQPVLAFELLKFFETGSLIFLLYINKEIRDILNSLPSLPLSCRILSLHNTGMSLIQPYMKNHPMFIEIPPSTLLDGIDGLTFITWFDCGTGDRECKFCQLYIDLAREIAKNLKKRNFEKFSSSLSTLIDGRLELVIRYVDDKHPGVGVVWTWCG